MPSVEEWPIGLSEVDAREAIDWFRAKVPMRRHEWDQLTESARAKAFMVSGVAQLSLVADTWRALDKAITDGTTLEDFKEAIGEKLIAAWGESVSDPAWRLECIFRTNVQSAYAAGRQREQADPQLRKVFPFLQFHAVLDSRTSEICNECDGVVLPADDPWWDTHQPPLHHGCRSTTVSLTEEDARAEGLTKVKPEGKPAEGFGAPLLDAKPWEPDPQDYPEQLWKEHETKPEPPPPPQMEEGKHVGKLSSKLDPEETRRVINTVADEGTLRFLEDHPLRELNLGTEYLRPGVNGQYDPNINTVAIATKRDPDSFGYPLEPGFSWSVSKVAEVEAEAIRRTFVHEFGHHLHFAGLGGDVAEKVDDEIRYAYLKSGRKGALTQYGKVSHVEYFAECYAAYHFQRAELAAHDPMGLQMVEKVLRLRGILP